MGNQHRIPRRGTKTLQTRVDVTNVHDGKGDATINFSQQVTTQTDVHEKGKASYSEVHQEAVQKRQSDEIDRRGLSTEDTRNGPGESGPTMDPTSKGELWVVNLVCDFEPMEVSSFVMDTQPIFKGVDDAAHKVIC